MSTCNICCEKFNKSSRACVECMYCQFPACRECCKTYIISEPVAKCMNSACDKEWTRKFLRDSFSATFINRELKAWRENLLFEREKALLPATQIYAEARYRIRAIDKEISAIDNDAITALINKKLELKQELYDIDVAIGALFGQKRQLKQERDRLWRDPTTLNAAGGGGAPEVEERRQFMQPCSVDDCRGYLSTQWKCGLCSTWACPDCHEVIGQSKDAEHTCDPNNVETARVLKKETKPCPKCSAAIFKIDGCDQIWCTQCHTAFSWKTGKLETKIHNPHYYEWLRNTQGSVPRDPLDVPVCEDGITLESMLRQFRELRRHKVMLRDQGGKYEAVYDKLMTFIQNIIHLQQAEIRVANNYEWRNRELRVSFLLNEIDEDQLKMRLQQADKKFSKQRDCQTVYEMVVAASTDILRRFLRQVMRAVGTYQEVDTSILDEMTALSKYANECLVEAQYVYGGDVKLFTPLLKLVDKYEIINQAFDLMKMKYVYEEGSFPLEQFIDKAQNHELDASYKSTTSEYARRVACLNYAIDHVVSS